MADTDAAALEATWVGLQLPAELKSAPAGVTIRPDASMPSTTPLSTLSIARGTGGEFELLDRLGEGGMSVIDRALQRSLGREVAIKRARTASSEGAAALLSEARIAGALEHPNVIPVHAIGADPEGAPAIVMKRVLGSTWRAIIHDDEHEFWARTGVLDRERWHIDTLLTVCHALELAHSRGIVHRDLKPENVMVGDFGEVYVLDWGIAIRTGAQSTSGSLAGTPAYMAPEMVRGGPITVRTDVYLLGAVLHEVLVGEPPHRGASLYALIQSIVEADGPPPLPDEVPEELGAICGRALSVDPEDRFESVRAFRESLQAFEVHRESLALTDEGYRQLAIARELDDRTSAHVARTECRFAFRQALKIWPENPRARAGLDGCVLRMIAEELERDAPDAAALLQEDLGARDPAIEARIREVAERIATDEEDVAALRRAASERDPRQMLAQRIRIAHWVAAIVALGGAAILFVIRMGLVVPTYELLLFSQVPVVIAALAVCAHYLRGANLANKQMALGAASIAVYPLLVRGLAWRFDVEPLTSMAFEISGYALGIVIGTIILDWRYWPAASHMVLCACLGLVFPSRLLELGLLGTLGTVLLVARRWKRLAPAG